MEKDYREEVRQGRVDMTDPLEFFGAWPCGCDDEECEDCKQGICEHD